MAWIRYATESVRYIFFSPSDAIEQARTNEVAQKIEDFLLARGQATRREITMECFQGHVTKSRIDAAIASHALHSVSITCSGYSIRNAQHRRTAGIGIGIIELLGMIFSMLLCCAIRKIEDFKA